MKISDIIKTDEALSYEPCTELEIKCIATEINCIGEDCLYVLESAERIPDFSSCVRPPMAIIAEQNVKIPEEIPSVRVNNARLASAVAHSRFYGVDYEKIKIVGVTGTNGKTSVATMIYKILNENGIKAGFIGTGKIEIIGKRLSDKYYSMTTPPPQRLYKILRKMQDEGCYYIVMEVSSHALTQMRVAAIPFEYGVFTNLTSAHLDYHLDTEEYYNAKKALLEQSKRVILNVDDQYGRRAAEEFSVKASTVGVLWRGNAYATEIEDRGFDGSSYFYHEKCFHYKAVLKLAGLYNVYNSMLAARTCIDIGIAPCKVKASLAKIEAIDGRYEIIKDKITVIIDYAHTSAGFASVLKSINDSKGCGKLTVVFGCGGDRDRSSRPQMGATAEKYADKIILTTDNSRSESPSSIFNDIISGIRHASYEICADRTEAIRSAVGSAKVGDVVAIIGKGCEEYLIDSEGYHEYSDKAVAVKALKELHAKKAL